MLFSALSTFIWLTAAFALHSILERDITPPNALDLTITANKGIPIPGTLYGAMFEDINHRCVHVSHITYVIPLIVEPTVAMEGSTVWLRNSIFVYSAHLFPRKGELLQNRALQAVIPHTQVAYVSTFTLPPSISAHCCLY
jgi:hypothetical protein